jgi:hypothetical protein
VAIRKAEFSWLTEGRIRRTHALLSRALAVRSKESAAFYLLSVLVRVLVRERRESFRAEIGTGAYSMTYEHTGYGKDTNNAVFASHRTLAQCLQQSRNSIHHSSSDNDHHHSEAYDRYPTRRTEHDDYYEDNRGSGILNSL